MAGEKNRRRGRRAYLEDFHKTANGEYVYTGAYYTYQGETMTWRQSMAVRLGLSVGAVALAVLGGMIPAPGMGGCFYVLLPYVCALISSVSVVWAAARMAHWGDPLREYVYQKTVAVLPLRCLLTAVFSAVTLVGAAVYLLLRGDDGAGPACTILFFALQAGVLGCALGLRWLEHRQKWSK